MTSNIYFAECQLFTVMLSVSICLLYRVSLWFVSLWTLSIATPSITTLLHIMAKMWHTAYVLQSARFFTVMLSASLCLLCSVIMLRVVMPIVVAPFAHFSYELRKKILHDVFTSSTSIYNLINKTLTSLQLTSKIFLLNLVLLTNISNSFWADIFEALSQ